jgi:hypothetical protein
MAQGGLVEVGGDGSVLFKDDRFAWAYPNRTVAIQRLLSNGTLARSIDSQVRQVGGLARGIDGEIYVSDTAGHRVLRFTSDGAASVVAGTGVAGFAGDGGPAYLAQMNTPRALSVGIDGDLYVAEFGRVRVITTDGNIFTVANEHANGLAHDRFGLLYFTAGRSIFAVAATGQLIRIAGTESAPPGLNEGGLALATRLSDPRGLAISGDDEIYVADAADHVVRRLIRNVPSALNITAGNNQTVPFGSLPELMSVRVTGRTGQPVPGVAVQFAFSSSPAQNISTSVTNNNGVASIRPGVANRAGSVTITASAIGLQPVQFTIRVGQ